MTANHLGPQNRTRANLKAASGVKSPKTFPKTYHGTLKLLESSFASILDCRPRNHTVIQSTVRTLSLPMSDLEQRKNYASHHELTIHRLANRWVHSDPS